MYLYQRRAPGQTPHALVAAARFLAAHSPTPRSANQTYMIAWRLNRGENVFEE